MFGFLGRLFARKPAQPRKKGAKPTRPARSTGPEREALIREAMAIRNKTAEEWDKLDPETRQKVLDAAFGKGSKAESGKD